MLKRVMYTLSSLQLVYMPLYAEKTQLRSTEVRSSAIIPAFSHHKGFAKICRKTCLWRRILKFTKAVLSASGRIAILGETVSLSPMPILAIAHGDMARVYI